MYTHFLSCYFHRCAVSVHSPVNWESSLGTQFPSFERLKKLEFLTMQRRSLIKGVQEWGAQSSRQPMDVLWAKTPKKASLLYRKRCFAHPASSLGDPCTTWAADMLGTTSVAELCCLSDVFLHNLLIYTQNPLAEAVWHF